MHDGTTCTSRWLLLEYFEGESLVQLLQRNDILSERVTVHILRAVASAVAMIHQNGLYHTDIKPDNIFVDRHGAVKLLSLKLTGGTRQYRGHEHEDPDADWQLLDVHSFGVTLFRCLINKSPFTDAATNTDRLYALFHRKNEDFWRLFEEFKGIPDLFSVDTKNLINRTICWNAADRWSFDAIL